MNDKPAQATATEIAMQHAPTRGEATAQQLRRIHGLNDHDRELVQHAADMLEIASRAPRAEVVAPEALAHREAVAERLSHLVAMRYADKIELHRHTLNEAARLLRTLPAAPEGEG